MITKKVLDPKAYVGRESAAIVVGIVYRHVLAPVFARKGLIGNLFGKHYRNLGPAFALPRIEKSWPDSVS